MPLSFGHESGDPPTDASAVVLGEGFTLPADSYAGAVAAVQARSQQLFDLVVSPQDQSLALASARHTALATSAVSAGTPLAAAIATSIAQAKQVAATGQTRMAAIPLAPPSIALVAPLLAPVPRQR